MEGQIILTLILTIPVILIPAAFVWYLNASGIYSVIRETQKRRISREKRIRAAAELEGN
ncbi:hypothetical protein ACFLUY_01615 [Chloroflexota bacterium]